MAREEVGSANNIQFIKYADLQPGEELEGWYVEHRLSRFKDAGGGDKYDHLFKRKDGTLFMLNGAGQLDSKMAFVPIGTWTIVQYGGKEAMKKGPFAGTAAHQFKVFTDKDVPVSPFVPEHAQQAPAADKEIPF